MTISSLQKPIRAPGSSIRLSIAAAAVLLLAACNANGGGAGSPSASASASSDTGGGLYQISVADSSLGSILTGADGKTLYLFDKDSDGKSACSGNCAGNWPPFTVPAGQTATAGDGVTGELGTITRDDGSTQVTIAGHPLYYFAADKAPGDTKGQGVSDIWWAVSPSGEAIQAAGGSSAPSASASASASAPASASGGAGGSYQRGEPDYGY